MRPGQHAASEGSSPRIHVGRAIGLLVVAVAVGVIWLHHTAPSKATAVAAHPATTAAPAHPPTTTAASTPPSSTAGPRPPATFKVLVANGTVANGGGSQHLAGTVSSMLHGHGYDTLAGANATQAVAASVIYFQPGYNQEAASVAQVLSLPVSVVQPMPAQPPVASLAGANILVVAGPDLAKTAGTPTTPTTAGHTSSTISSSTTAHR